jgi:hypothetical protein
MTPGLGGNEHPSLVHIPHWGSLPEERDFLRASYVLAYDDVQQ